MAGLAPSEGGWTSGHSQLEKGPVSLLWVCLGVQGTLRHRLRAPHSRHGLRSKAGMDFRAQPWASRALAPLGTGGGRGAFLRPPPTCLDGEVLLGPWELAGLRFPGRESFAEENQLSLGAVPVGTFSNAECRNGAENIVRPSEKPGEATAGDKT